MRFSADKTPYKLSCAAHLTGGYVSVSADGLFVGSGLYMPMPDDLKRFRAAVDDDRDRRRARSDRRRRCGRRSTTSARTTTLKTAPRGYPKDHPRIELLQLKGIVMSKSWPVGGWLGTEEGEGSRRDDPRGGAPAQRVARRSRARAGRVVTGGSAPAAGIAAIFSSVSSSHRISGSAQRRGRGAAHDPLGRDDDVDVDVVCGRRHRARREHLAFVHGGDDDGVRVDEPRLGRRPRARGR